MVVTKETVKLPLVLPTISAASSLVWMGWSLMATIRQYFLTPALFAGEPGRIFWIRNESSEMNMPTTSDGVSRTISTFFMYRSMICITSSTDECSRSQLVTLSKARVSSRCNNLA